MLANFFGWILIGFGVLTLTEGFYRFRRFAEEAEWPGRYWWLAGLIGALGLGLMSFGFGLKLS